MLKTVSSITNAIGALNYRGAWNANTNSPALASGVGTKGDYYQVSVAGATFFGQLGHTRQVGTSSLVLGLGQIVELRKAGTQWFVMSTQAA